MNAKQYGWMLALCVVASFAGGVTSNRIFTALPDVLAQVTPRERLQTAPVQRAPSAPLQIQQVSPSSGEQVITVPATPGGLAFKTPDGKILARLKAGTGAGHTGGEFTLFDVQGFATAQFTPWGDLVINPEGTYKTTIRASGIIVGDTTGIVVNLGAFDPRGGGLLIRAPSRDGARLEEHRYPIPY
jgi:hypothetical protein